MPLIIPLVGPLPLHPVALVPHNLTFGRHIENTGLLIQDLIVQLYQTLQGDVLVT